MSAEDYFEFSDMFDQMEEGLHLEAEAEAEWSPGTKKHQKGKETMTEITFQEMKDAAKAEVELEKTGGAICEYSFVEERLSELRAKYAEVPDAETKDGYEFIRKGIRELVSCRTDIEKIRKEIKAPVLLRSKLIDSEAKRITAAISEMEAPLKDAKLVVDERKRREKEERERIERERVEAIETVIDKIDRTPMLALGKSAEEIQSTIEQVKAYEITEDSFQEFTERAQIAKKDTLDRLWELHSQAVEVEKARASFEAQKEELERERAEIEAARAALEAEKEKSKEKAQPIQTAEQVAADLKDGIVKTEGESIDEETPEEQAAKSLAFTCGLGNEQARTVVDMIKTGNVPHITFFPVYNGVDEYLNG